MSKPDKCLKNKMPSCGIMEQVCDLSFHLKFYLHLHANRVKSYTDQNKVLCLTFAKSWNWEKQLKIEIKHRKRI